MRNGVVPGSRGGLPLQRLEQRGVDACDSVQAQNTPKPSPWTAKASPCGPNCRLGRAKPSPCHSRSVALRGRSRRVPARMVPMFALAMADRNRRPFVSAQDRLASPPRAPDRLRAGPALGHDRHALLEFVGRLARHPTARAAAATLPCCASASRKAWALRLVQRYSERGRGRRASGGACVIRQDEADRARVGKWFLRSRCQVCFGWKADGRVESASLSVVALQP